MRLEHPSGLEADLETVPDRVRRSRRPARSERTILKRRARSCLRWLHSITHVRNTQSATNRSINVLERSLQSGAFDGFVSFSSRRRCQSATSDPGATYYLSGNGHGAIDDAKPCFGFRETSNGGVHFAELVRLDFRRGSPSALGPGHF